MVDGLPPQPAEGFFRYLPVAAGDRAWGLWVTAGGNTRIPAHSPYPPQLHPEGYQFSWKSGRVLNEFQFIYVTRGRGVFESKPTRRKPVEAGTLFILFPGVWHRYSPAPETGWEEHWISFDGPYARKLCGPPFFSPAQAVLVPGLDPGLSDAYRRLVEELRATRMGHAPVLSALAHEIVARTRAATLSRRADDPEMESLMRKARFLLEENAHRRVRMEAVAAELRLGYSWFRKAFRRHTGLSPKQYLLQFRLRRAKEMLGGTDLLVKQIASALAFDSPYHFTKQFQKKAGMSPVAWRRFSRGQDRRPARPVSRKRR
jgi:AraC-like DNA-binding protein